jgi:hypothetical protein
MPGQTLRFPPRPPRRSERGSLLAYFASGWSWVDLASNGLLAACTCLWWGLVGQQAQHYEVRGAACRLCRLPPKP